MTSENNLSNSPLKKRGVIIVLAGLLTIGIIAGGIAIREHEPNYYAPGRINLVNAKVKLEQTIALEQTYVRKRRQAHHEIETAINDLASVAEVDEQDRILIAKLLQQLKDIESADLSAKPDGNAIHQQYLSVIRQLDALIQKLEKLRP